MQPDTAPTLKPCPFCGSEMELVHDHTVEDIDRIRHKIPQISCPISGASGFSIGNDNLIAAWNTRATQPTACTECERLAEALEEIANGVERRLPTGETVVDDHPDASELARSALASHTVRLIDGESGK